MNQKISAKPAGRQMLNWRASVSRLLGVATLAGSVLLFAGSLRANTELDVANGLAANSDLAVGTSYTAGTAPTATSDVTFNATNTYTSPYTFGSAVTLGSLNDLSATPLTISGTRPTLSGGDSVSGNTGDLYYVGTGANLTVSAPLLMGQTGNFDVVGTSTISGVISDGSNGNSAAPTGNPYNFVKTGTGTLILSGNNLVTGGYAVNAGTLQLNFGGQSYSGVRGAVTVNAGGTLALNAGDALGYSAITAGNSVAQLTINGGTVNIMVNANEGFTANLTMTGGTFSSTGGGAFNINPAAANAPSITTNASATTALISAPVVQRSGAASLPFNVASGTTASGSDLTVSGVISGGGTTGGITKNGAGTMLLTAVNTFTGPTTVNAGRLLVSGGGSLAAGSAAVVTGTGTTFGGSGTVNGTVNIGNGSILTARNGTGTTTSTVGALTTGALTLQTGSTFNAFLAGGTNVSTLNSTGTTALGGAAFNISLATGATFTKGQILELITSTVSGTFTNSTFTTGGYTFTADYTNAPDPGAFAVDVSPAAVPEPSTWAGLLTMAALAGGAYRRRQAQVRLG